jgi:hypothetical protein
MGYDESGKNLRKGFLKAGSGTITFGESMQTKASGSNDRFFRDVDLSVVTSTIPIILTELEHEKSDDSRYTVALPKHHCFAESQT